MLWSRINNGANSNYHYVTRKNGHLYAGACIWITWHDVCWLFTDWYGYVKVGVQLGTTGDIYCTDDLKEAGSGTVEEYNKGADAVQALVTGKIDCVVIDNEPAKAFVKANKGLKLLKTAYAEEDYAIAVSKDKPELRKKINKALKELIDDGSVQKIINKYIKAE